MKPSPFRAPNSYADRLAQRVQRQQIQAAAAAAAAAQATASASPVTSASAGGGPTLQLSGTAIHHAPRDPASVVPVPQKVYQAKSSSLQATTSIGGPSNLKKATTTAPKSLTQQASSSESAKRRATESPEASNTFPTQPPTSFTISKVPSISAEKAIEGTASESKPAKQPTDEGTRPLATTHSKNARSDTHPRLHRLGRTGDKTESNGPNEACDIEVTTNSPKVTPQEPELKPELETKDVTSTLRTDGGIPRDQSVPLMSATTSQRNVKYHTDSPESTKVSAAASFQSKPDRPAPPEPLEFGVFSSEPLALLRKYRSLFTIHGDARPGSDITIPSSDDYVRASLSAIDYMCAVIALFPTHSHWSKHIFSKDEVEDASHGAKHPSSSLARKPKATNSCDPSTALQSALDVGSDMNAFLRARTESANLGVLKGFGRIPDLSSLSPPQAKPTDKRDITGLISEASSLFLFIESFFGLLSLEPQDSATEALLWDVVATIPTLYAELLRTLGPHALQPIRFVLPTLIENLRVTDGVSGLATRLSLITDQDVEQQLCTFRVGASRVLVLTMRLAAYFMHTGDPNQIGRGAFTTLLSSLAAGCLGAFPSTASKRAREYGDVYGILTLFELATIVPLVLAPISEASLETLLPSLIPAMSALATFLSNAVTQSKGVGVSYDYAVTTVDAVLTAFGALHHTLPSLVDRIFSQLNLDASIRSALERLRQSGKPFVRLRFNRLMHERPRDDEEQLARSLAVELLTTSEDSRPSSPSSEDAVPVHPKLNSQSSANSSSTLLFSHPEHTSSNQATTVDAELESLHGEDHSSPRTHQVNVHTFESSHSTGSNAATPRRNLRDALQGAADEPNVRESDETHVPLPSLETDAGDHDGSVRPTNMVTQATTTIPAVTKIALSKSEDIIRVRGPGDSADVAASALQLMVAAAPQLDTHSSPVYSEPPLPASTQDGAEHADSPSLKAKPGLPPLKVDASPFALPPDTTPNEAERSTKSAQAPLTGRTELLRSRRMSRAVSRPTSILASQTAQPSTADATVSDPNREEASASMPVTAREEQAQVPIHVAVDAIGSTTNETELVTSNAQDDEARDSLAGLRVLPHMSPRTRERAKSLSRSPAALGYTDRALPVVSPVQVVSDSTWTSDATCKSTTNGPLPSGAQSQTASVETPADTGYRQQEETEDEPAIDLTVDMSQLGNGVLSLRSHKRQDLRYSAYRARAQSAKASLTSTEDEHFDPADLTRMRPINLDADAITTDDLMPPSQLTTNGDPSITSQPLDEPQISNQGESPNADTKYEPSRRISVIGRNLRPHLRNQSGPLPGDTGRSPYSVAAEEQRPKTQGLENGSNTMLDSEGSLSKYPPGEKDTTMMVDVMSRQTLERAPTPQTMTAEQLARRRRDSLVSLKKRRASVAATPGLSVAIAAGAVLPENVTDQDNVVPPIVKSDFKSLDLEDPSIHAVSPTPTTDTPHSTSTTPQLWPKPLSRDMSAESRPASNRADRTSNPSPLPPPSVAGLGSAPASRRSIALGGVRGRGRSAKAPSNGQTSWLFDEDDGDVAAPTPSVPLEDLAVERGLVSTPHSTARGNATPSQLKGRSRAPSLAASSITGVSDESPTQHARRLDVEGAGAAITSPITYTQTSDLMPFDDPESDVLTIPNFFKVDTWDSQFMGIDMLRRALVHHVDYMTGYIPTSLPPLRTFAIRLCVLAESRRSQLAKNALLGLKDLFESAAPSVEASLVNASFAVLVRRGADQNEFLAQPARAALGSLVTLVNAQRVLSILAAASHGTLQGTPYGSSDELGPLLTGNGQGPTGPPAASAGTAAVSSSAGGSDISGTSTFSAKHKVVISRAMACWLDSMCGVYAPTDRALPQNCLKLGQLITTHRDGPKFCVAVARCVAGETPATRAAGRWSLSRLLEALSISELEAMWNKPGSNNSAIDAGLRSKLQRLLQKSPEGLRQSALEEYPQLNLLESNGTGPFPSLSTQSVGAMRDRSNSIASSVISSTSTSEVTPSERGVLASAAASIVPPTHPPSAHYRRESRPSISGGSYSDLSITGAGVGGVPGAPRGSATLGAGAAILGLAGGVGSSRSRPPSTTSNRGSVSSSGSLRSVGLNDFNHSNLSTVLTISSSMTSAGTAHQRPPSGARGTISAYAQTPSGASAMSGALRPRAPSAGRSNPTLLNVSGTGITNQSQPNEMSPAPNTSFSSLQTANVASRGSGMSGPGQGGYEARYQQSLTRQ